MDLEQGRRGLTSAKFKIGFVRIAMGRTNQLQLVNQPRVARPPASSTSVKKSIDRQDKSYEFLMDIMPFCSSLY